MRGVKRFVKTGGIAHGIVVTACKARTSPAGTARAGDWAIPADAARQSVAREKLCQQRSHVRQSRRLSGKVVVLRSRARSKRCILLRASRVAFLLAPMQPACMSRLRRTAYFQRGSFCTEKVRPKKTCGPTQSRSLRSRDRA